MSSSEASATRPARLTASTTRIRHSLITPASSWAAIRPCSSSGPLRRRPRFTARRTRSTSRARTSPSQTQPTQAPNSSCPRSPVQDHHRQEQGVPGHPARRPLRGASVELLREHSGRARWHERLHHRRRERDRRPISASLLGNLIKRVQALSQAPLGVFPVVPDGTRHRRSRSCRRPRFTCCVCPSLPGPVGCPARQPGPHRGHPAGRRYPRPTPRRRAGRR